MPNRPWFAPKVLGYGAGWPIAWQGWAVLVGFFAGLGLCLTYLHGPARPLAITGLVCVLVAICARTTDGGWRWRP